MNKFTSQIINQEVNNENKKIFYRFDNNLIYIIIIRVIIFIKIVYFMKRRNFFVFSYLLLLKGFFLISKLNLVLKKYQK